jgi:hypothetical protein
MTRLIESLTVALLAAVIVFLCVFAWWAHREAPLIHDAVWNTAASTWEVKQNSGRELVETNKVLAGTKDLIEHTDCNLNGCPGIGARKPTPGLLPAATILLTKAQPAMDNLTAAISHLDTVAQDLDGLVKSGTATTAELQGAVKTFQGAIGDLDKIITDPSIKMTLNGLAAATLDLDTSIKQLNLMLQSGTATALDIQRVADKVAEQYTKARNLYYALFKEVLSIGSQGVQFILKK